MHGGSGGSGITTIGGSTSVPGVGFPLLPGSTTIVLWSILPEGVLELTRTGILTIVESPGANAPAMLKIRFVVVPEFVTVPMSDVTVPARVRFVGKLSVKLIGFEVEPVPLFVMVTR